MTAVADRDNAFWRFSLAVYAAPGVADECLALQESHDIDVNVLLFCAWLACARKIALTVEDIVGIGAVVGPWHEGAVKPLRNVRRNMKIVPDADVAALRTRVKAAELDAEQYEQAMLFAYAETRWPVEEQAALPAVLRSNFEIYLRAHGFDGPGGNAMPLQHLSAAALASSGR